MEIEFSNSLYSKSAKPLNFKINSKEITTILCDYDKINILEYMYAREIPIEGYTKINKLKLRNGIKKNELKLISQKTASLNIDFFNVSILDDIKLSVTKLNKQKLNTLIETFYLYESILKKNYQELSSSEINKIKIIITLLRDTKIQIFNNPTKGLDSKSIDALAREILNLKKENKIVIILTYDTNFILKISDRIILIDNNYNTLIGNKYEILSNEKALKSINLNVPNIIKFTDVVRNTKNKKISYRDNIKDTMKDVYRNAK